MRAVVVEHRHELGTLRDWPNPVPGEREILVRVSAAGVNPVDWKRRDDDETPLPLVLGQDFAGVVAGVGAGVQRYAVDDRVFGIARAHGSYAELTVVPEDENQQPVAHIPNDVGDADAAALPTAALTALACVERVGVHAGEVLFIVGVTGAVGQYAAQIARDRGVEVAGSGKSDNAEVAQSLSLGAYVSYDREDVVSAVRAKYAQGVHAIIDLADNASALQKLTVLLRSGGTIASTIHAVDEAYVRERGLRGLNVNLFESPQSSHEGLRTIIDMVERGAIRAPIAAERNLSDAVEALELQKSGAISGKIIVTI